MSGSRGYTSTRVLGRPSVLAPSAVILFTLVITIPAITWIVADRWVYEYYSEHFLKPAVERRYGFSSEPRTASERSSYGAPFRIASVTPGGAFALSGVRAGDVPITHTMHGEHFSEFFGSLAYAPGQQLLLSFYRATDADTIDVAIMVPPKSTATPNPSLQRTRSARR